MTKKEIEFFLHDKNGKLTFQLMFVLLLAKKSFLYLKYNYKTDLI